MSFRARCLTVPWARLPPLQLFQLLAWHAFLLLLSWACLGCLVVLVLSLSLLDYLPAWLSVPVTCQEVSSTTTTVRH